MAKIRVDIETLRADVIRLETEIEIIENALKNNQKELDTLKTSWNGEAADEYRKNYKETVQNLKKLTKKIKKSVAKIKATNANYETCEAEVKTQINSIAV